MRESRLPGGVYGQGGRTTSTTLRALPAFRGWFSSSVFRLSLSPSPLSALPSPLKLSDFDKVPGVLETRSRCLRFHADPVCLPACLPAPTHRRYHPPRSFPAVTPRPVPPSGFARRRVTSFLCERRDCAFSLLFSRPRRGVCANSRPFVLPRSVSRSEAARTNRSLALTFIHRFILSTRSFVRIRQRYSCGYLCPGRNINRTFSLSLSLDEPYRGTRVICRENLRV